jgi:hypothetical protein
VTSTERDEHYICFVIIFHMSVLHIIPEYDSPVYELDRTIFRLNNVKNRLSSHQIPFLFTNTKLDFLEAAQTLRRFMELISGLPQTILVIQAKYAIRALCRDLSTVLGDAMHYTISTIEFRNIVLSIIDECANLVIIMREVSNTIN